MNIFWIIVIVIAGLWVIGAAILLLRAIFFSSRINSIISIILMIGVSVFVLFFLKGDNIDPDFLSKCKWLLLLFVIPIIDCLRDIILANEFYEQIEMGETEVDKFYAAKSILSIITIELARYVYLLIVCPIIATKVKKEIQNKISSGLPLPYYTNYSNSPRFQYYYNKYTSKYEKMGLIVSNIATVKSETAIRKKRLDALYPEKIMQMIIDKVAGDAKDKEMRKEAEKKLSYAAISKYYAYIGSNYYEQIPQAVINAMSSRGPMSSIDIISLPEMSSLNFKEIHTDIASIDNKWAEYFLIMALVPLVASNEFSDDDFGVKDPMDNHHYQYLKSTKQMLSVNADEDPLFALD